MESFDGSDVIIISNVRIERTPGDLEIAAGRFDHFVQLVHVNATRGAARYEIGHLGYLTVGIYQFRGTSDVAVGDWLCCVVDHAAISHVSRPSRCAISVVDNGRIVGNPPAVDGTWTQLA